MRDQHSGQAPDYTDAFLVSAGVVLFMTLWMIAVLAGHLWVWLTATALDVGIRRLRRD
ncbi:MAG: hypothetical protein LC676_08205 [Loktanella sp.]|nr:hypothetical protein [Loktanella sp.]